MSNARARLSFRESKHGGGVRSSPREDPSGALARQPRPLLLIHGYNNDWCDADRAYASFEDMQRQLANLPPGCPVADGRLVEVYWPGDASWGPASFLYYMHSIRRAKETAPHLANAIKKAVIAGGFKQVDIIAHSMGCRLALELLKHLKDISDLVLRRIVFMAGAVPVFMLEPGLGNKGLRQAYDEVIADAAESLYSPSDKVLSLAFPLGQSLARGDEGTFPVALGHDVWAGDIPPNLVQHHIEGAHHSDYWPGGERKRKKKRERAARLANERVEEFLNLAGPRPREIAAREIGERDSDEGRWISDSRQIENRVLGSEITKD